MTETVILNDTFTKNLDDKLMISQSGNHKSISRPRGRVQIYDVDKNGNKTLLQDTSNLIVFLGRNWVMKRVFTQSTRTPPVGPPYYSDDKDLYINWFGVGTKGCSPADVLLPIAPLLSDTHLNQNVPGELPSIIDPSTTTNPRSLNLSTSEYYRRILPIDGIAVSVTYIEDPENQGQYLIAQISTTLTETECNGDLGTLYTDISEAGLFISNTNDASDSIGNIFYDGSVKLFARVTFSSIRKYSERRIAFMWYIYF